MLPTHAGVGKGQRAQRCDLAPAAQARHQLLQAVPLALRDRDGLQSQVGLLQGQRRHSVFSYELDKWWMQPFWLCHNMVIAVCSALVIHIALHQVCCAQEAEAQRS